MPCATLTSKGQITIPIQVRTALGLDAGDKIDFVEIEKGQFAIKPRTGSIMELRGCLAYDGPAITIEEMHQALLDRAAELDKATMSGALQGRPDGEAA
jgi:AbrB family looped-hinge helix DNA binding protein